MEILESPKPNVTAFFFSGGGDGKRVRPYTRASDGPNPKPGGHQTAQTVCVVLSGSYIRIDHRELYKAEEKGVTERQNI
jgi:hypothetical protein